jgi:transcriptional regulator with XRE-family HTH domain
MDVRRVVARNLRRLRVARQLSQENLAVDAEIDRTHVGRIERGLENPTIQVVDRLARALRVDIRELFTPIRAGEPALKPLPSGRRPSRR